MVKFIKGQRVIKKSFKPFKNGSKVQTILDFSINPNKPEPCAVFDDESICNLTNLILLDSLVIVKFNNNNYLCSQSNYDNIFTNKQYIIINQNDLLRIIGRNEFFMKVIYNNSKDKEQFDIPINKNIPIYEVVRIIQNDEIKTINLPTFVFSLN